MKTRFDYYYNNVPNHGKCRNNLVYTSLISHDKKTFCQWYYNDINYHGGKNKVIDPQLMEDKWRRELKFLLKMQKNFPQHVLKIIDIDYASKKIYYQIQDVDFWELSRCSPSNYSNIVPNWDKQLLEIIQSHYTLNFFKFSLHPSSYFVIDGKLKSINYFFCYSFLEPDLKIKNIFSHISENRLNKLIPLMKRMDIDFTKPEPLHKIQMLAFETFKTDFPDYIMDKAKEIYV